MIQIVKFTSDQQQIGVPPATQHIRIVAVWMRSDKDSPDQEFEYKLIIFLPPNNKEIEVGAGRFKFSKPLHRFTINILGPLPFEGPGMMNVQSKIRKEGDQDWLKQEYPIVLEEVIPQ